MLEELRNSVSGNRLRSWLMLAGLIVLAGGLSACDDSSSNNNDSGTSYTITINDIYSYSGSSVEVVYYVTSSAGEQTANWSFWGNLDQSPSSSTGGGWNIDVIVYGGENVYYEDVIPYDGEDDTTDGIYAGTAYIQMEKNGTYSSNSGYAWSFRDDCNSMSNLTQITESSTATTSSQQYGTSTWYYLTAASTQTVTATLDNNGIGDPGLTMYDSTCNELDSSDLVGTDTVSYPVTSGQTYYYEVYSEYAYNSSLALTP